MTVAEFAARLGLTVTHAALRRAVARGVVLLDGRPVESAYAPVGPGMHSLRIGRLAWGRV